MAEQGKLRGLPYFVRCLYVLAIRPYMDMTTGMVGLRSQISYGSLAADMHVEPHQGEQDSGTPTTSRIKRGVQRLIKAGLLENRSVSTPTYKRLVFFCPVADTGQFVQKKPGPNSDHSPGPQPGPLLGLEKYSNYGASDEDYLEQPGPQSEPPENAKAGSHPESGYLYDEANASSLSQASPGDDPRADGSPSKKPKSNRLPNCPHEEILALWEKHFPDKPHPVTWDSCRQRHLAARWRAGFSVKHRVTQHVLYTDLESGIAWWDKFFAWCAKQSFLRDKPFFTIDWIIKPSNFAKVMDGNYQGDGQ